MPQLFTLPRAVPLSSIGGLLPGAKLYFTKTGTSTPQNVYQDTGLTVPHANPVQADGNGVFPKIYLDASLPDYRVKLTTSTDVQLDLQDDIPAGQNTSQSFRIVDVAPDLIFEETDASANNGKWRFRVNSERLAIDLGNDAESAWVNVLSIDRTGTTPDSVAIGGNTIATQSSGSFTGTLTGFVSNPTPTVQWRKTGNKVTLIVQSNATGTSNATSMTLTGIPVELQPVVTSQIKFCVLEDNSSFGIGTVNVSGGILTFGVGASGGAFTGSGGKGLLAGFTVDYDIG